jgi:hypothetical protein
MAFFAVMLPDVFTDGAKKASLESDILSSFKSMPNPDAVKQKRDNLVKLGQLIRDSIVSTATRAPLPKPPSAPGGTPAGTPAGTATPPPAPRGSYYATEADIRRKWDNIKGDRRRRGAIAPADETAADAAFNAYLATLTPSIASTPKNTINGVIARTITPLLRGVSRHRTPRRISKRHSYKQKLGH